MARYWHRHTAAEDELTWATRYNYKRAENIILKKEIEKLRMLDAAGISVRVKTCGECLPASGNMMWKGQGYVLVWWDGSDAPMVWPCENIEVMAELSRITNEPP